MLLVRWANIQQLLQQPRGVCVCVCVVRDMALSFDAAQPFNSVMWLFPAQLEGMHGTPQKPTEGKKEEKKCQNDFQVLPKTGGVTVLKIGTPQKNKLLAYISTPWSVGDNWQIDVHFGSVISLQLLLRMKNNSFFIPTHLQTRRDQITSSHIRLCYSLCAVILRMHSLFVLLPLLPFKNTLPIRSSI